MPKLNKIRIVNFFYNDGNRLIADELYDFKDNNAKAPNVLINLANGGGKSVLVQLMMQPILPKAKASGRKIESFFTKPNYHSYVLLEWQKDNSPERLLTGISMRTATNSDKDEKTMGGKIQYYTFYSEYMYDYDAESLFALKLSTKQNGNFIAAEYDYIKKLSKNQNRLKCYSQEKSREWKEKLQEFYIYPNEWEMIEKINAVEGGLDKFFEEYRSSDNLIDKLMIPAIENQIHGESADDTTKDTSLTTMFLGYAESYRKSAEHLRKQELYKKYKSVLEPLVLSFKELFELEDHARRSKRKLYGFADALVIQKLQLENNQEEIKEKIQNSEEEIYQIQYEEVSANYYIAKRNQENAKQEKENAKIYRDNLKLNEEQTLQEIKIQECAEYFAKIQKLSSEITAIQLKIDSLEQNSDISQQIRNLKHSVHNLADEKIARLTQKINNDESILKTRKLEQEKLSAQLQILEEELQELKYKTSVTTGKLEQIKEDTDSLIEQNNFDITRNILGEYEVAGIQTLENKIKNNLLNKENTKKEITENIESLQGQKYDIPQQIAEEKQKLLNFNQGKVDLQTDIEAYKLEYNAVYKICEEYSLDTDMIFNGKLAKQLQNKISDKEVSVIRLKNQLQTKEKLLSSAQKGNVHIQEEVINFLDAEGISYTICEKYLLNQIADNSKTNKQVSELLKKYPFLAYSIVMDNSEYQKICEFSENNWLSTVVPVFTYQEFEKYLQQFESTQKFIANYSHQLFENQNKFLENLQNEITNLDRELNTIEFEKDDISKKHKTVTNFAYSSDWLSIQKQKQQELEKDTTICAIKIQELENKRKGLSNKIREQESVKDTIQKEIYQIGSQLKVLKNIIDNIQKEQNLSNEIHDLENQLQILNQKKENITKTLEEINCIIHEIKSDLDENNIQLEFSQKAYNNTSSSEDAEVIDGKLEDLYQQYQELSKKQSSDIEILKDHLNNNNAAIKEKQTEISKRQIEKSLYKNVIYNAHKYEELENNLSIIKRTLENAIDNFNDKDKIFYTTQQKLISCEETLKEYGEPILESQIHSNFAVRIQEVRQKIKNLKKQLSATSNKISDMENILERLGDSVDTPQRNEDAVTIPLQEDIKVQFKNLLNEWKNNKNMFSDALQKTKGNLESAIIKFEQDPYQRKDALIHLSEMLNKAEGEYIFSLNEIVSKYIDSADKMINKIESDLTDLKNDQYHLSKQCTMHAKQIYEGLEQIKNAKVKVYENKQSKNMLKIDIPEHFDFESAQKIIESELKNNVEQFSNQDFKDNEQKQKEASKFVSSRQLLRIAIQKSNLSVHAYKIDQNPEHAKYRTWEESLKNNSGAEKFIVYLSIILSIMNYSKSMSAGIQNNSAYSLLILDNPFGSTTSPHILNPMFHLAKHFNVQMICLTHIIQNDVIKCFDCVIKAFVKKMAMSSKELLKHEFDSEVEAVNHGFYSVSEQLTLF